MILQGAVVYCGGCNPEIDREETVRAVEQKTGIPFPHIKKAGCRPDILLVVNGCPRCCLCEEEYRDKAGRTIVIAGPSIDCWPVDREELADALAEKVSDNIKGAGNNG